MKFLEITIQFKAWIDGTSKHFSTVWVEKKKHFIFQRKFVHTTIGCCQGRFWGWALIWLRPGLDWARVYYFLKNK